MCEILKKDQVIQFIKHSFVSIYNQDINFKQNLKYPFEESAKILAKKQTLLAYTTR